MIELKPGDVFKVTRPFQMSFDSEQMQVEASFDAGKVFTVAEVRGDKIYSQAHFHTNLHSAVITYCFDASDVEEGAIEILRPVEEDPETPTEPEVPEEPEMPEREPAAFRLSFFSAQNGRHRPSANLLQLVASKLAEVKNEPGWALSADGVFGNGTEATAKAIQAAYGLTADGVIGKGTWRATTPDLGTWRPPLRFRIMENQCTWEAGKSTYGYYGLIKWEGWYNYGVYNVNKWSARTLVTLGGAGHLRDKIDQADSLWAEGSEDSRAKSREVAAEVGYWFGSKVGRETQWGPYFLKYVLKPSVKNLANLGWDVTKLGFASLDECLGIDDAAAMDEHLAQMSPFYERLLLQACDITINSGAGGYFPKKSPRSWGGHGDEAWPTEKLPFKEEAKQIYAETFGGEIPNDYVYLTSDTRDTYRDALKRCLDELCQNDEQRIALIAELQARCVIDKWRGDVIRRRRAVAWPEGHAFQQSFFCMSEHFGIGI